MWTLRPHATVTRMTHTQSIRMYETNTSGKRLRYPVFSWSCTCGSFHKGDYFRSREKCSISFLRHFNDRALEPPHLPTYTQDELGRYLWSCSCGDLSRVGGHPNDARANQSFTRHVSRALLAWYDHPARAAMNPTKFTRPDVTARPQPATDSEGEQRDIEHVARWNRLSPEGRARYVARSLDELL